MNEGGWSIINSSKEEEAAPLQRQKSFAWRGGQQRQTTGIWMWSEPFIRATDSTNGEKIAILLMDTQGMFDNETTMTLTAQIFGLSTLVSSFQVRALLSLLYSTLSHCTQILQIYNVDKRIQEDNLQHLALFSEYGRMALLPQVSHAKHLPTLDTRWWSILILSEEGLLVDVWGMEERIHSSEGWDVAFRRVLLQYIWYTRMMSLHSFTFEWGHSCLIFHRRPSASSCLTMIERRDLMRILPLPSNLLINFFFLSCL